MKPFEQLKDFGRKVVRRYPGLRPYAAKAIEQVRSGRNTQLARTIAGDSDLAQRVLNSPYFDPHYYRQAAGIPNFSDIETAWHYIKIGETQGLRPSRTFDPDFYRNQHPDLKSFASSLLIHYSEHGRREGRSGYFDITEHLIVGNRQLSGSLKTVLLVLHEASMTGAPILGLNIARHLGARYNIIIISFRGGKLLPILLKYSSVVISGSAHLIASMHPSSLKGLLIERIIQDYNVDYVLANSAETENVVVACADVGLPVVSLVHEFSEYVVPFSRMRNVLSHSTITVFSSELTLKSALNMGNYTSLRNTIVIPQGKSVVPADSDGELISEKLENIVKSAADKSRLLCIGCGYVQIRKGVDLFIAIASKIASELGSENVQFIWVGDGYEPDKDPHYSLWLQDQISRSGLESNFAFVPAVGPQDLENLYLAADFMILSSRLDPFPNVAIDAFHAGLPLVCFDKASGIAEYISRDQELRSLVVPYLDLDAAAKVIIELANDSGRRERIAEQFRHMASERFEMRSYVDKLSDLMERASKIIEQERLDVESLTNQNALDSETLTDSLGVGVSASEAPSRYVRFTAAGTHSYRGMFRRPHFGFSPHIYREKHPELEGPLSPNPLSHWIRNERVDGPWTHRVLTLANSPRLTKTSKANLAIHIHLHYPSVLDDLITRLEVNDASPDLYISATSDTAAMHIEKRLKSYHRGKVSVRATPNRGRDIGPMLTQFSEELVEYDIIGHIHGKKSDALNKMTGANTQSDVWREFLFQNLVGDRYRALDIIIDAFQDDATLGLVFPEDPTIVGWTANYAPAQAVAKRIGLSPDLPRAIEFPAGNMFFARPDALRPLFDARYEWSDYPKEPIPYDGTILHAIERLTPIICEKQGYRWMTTHAPGFTR